MSNKKSGMWGIALPLSVVFLGAAYYVKVPEIRKEVDARTPVVRNLLGRFVQEPVTVVVMKSEQDPAFAKPKTQPASAPVAVPTEARSVSNQVPGPVAPSVAEPATLLEISLQQLAGDPTKWPKKVMLNRPVKFPAVLNGKVVGELVAPAGAEANLKSIKDDKVGLEFNGGGAWLPADQTDLVARANSARSASR